jgi:hypothetical protein
MASISLIRAYLVLGDLTMTIASAAAAAETRPIRNRFSRSTALACTALALSWVYHPSEAHADSRVWGAVAAGVGAAIVGGMLLNNRRQPQARPQARRQPSSRQQQRRDQDDGLAMDRSQGSPRSADPAVLAKLAPPTARQMTVLKSIVPAAAIGAAGVTLDPNATRSTELKDRERDYTLQIQTFLAEFRGTRDREGANGGGTDVTLLSLERVIDRHFEQSGLREFSRFQGENWSAERLKVMVVNRARAELRGSFVGSRQGSSLDQIEAVFERSAQVVFRQMFETSELLAANKSAASFTERLYQKDAGKVSSSHVREELEDDLNRVARTMVDEYERLWQRDENRFAYRYRAQRVVFDCLAADQHVDVVTTDVGGGAGSMPVRDVIRMKLASTVRAHCAQWLDQQFVEGYQGVDGASRNARAVIDGRARLALQKPVALRAIWTAAGPQDDAAM